MFASAERLHRRHPKLDRSTPPGEAIGSEATGLCPGLRSTKTIGKPQENRRKTIGKP